MHDSWSLSNATKFGKPPEGWSIVCANGNYAPKTPLGSVMNSLDFCVRTSKWEAVVAAWRIKGIWDAKAKVRWKECDEQPDR